MTAYNNALVEVLLLRFADFGGTRCQHLIGGRDILGVSIPVLTVSRQND